MGGMGRVCVFGVHGWCGWVVCVHSVHTHVLHGVHIQRDEDQEMGGATAEDLQVQAAAKLRAYEQGSGGNGGTGDAKGACVEMVVCTGCV